MPQFETIAFHIGFPKTGTTAIQEYISKNTDVLERHGWCYFGGEVLGQNVGINAMVLMWTLTGGLGEHKLPGHSDDAPEMVEIFHRWIQQQRAKNLLISSENLALFDESRWRQILVAMKPYRSKETCIRILQVVRHPLIRALSVRNQSVKVSGSLTCSPWPRCHNLSTGELSAFFADLFEDCCSHFEVRRFEDLLDENLLSGFLRWLGLPIENVESDVQMQVNSSVSLESKWIMASAGRVEPGTWNYKFGKAMEGFPGVRDGWQEEEAREFWASIVNQENAYLASIGLKTYTFEEGFRPMCLENLWSEAFCDAWRKSLKSLSRAQVKRMLEVLQKLQPEVAQDEWPEEARVRFERLRRVTWKWAHMPKLLRM